MSRPVAVAWQCCLRLYLPSRPDQPQSDRIADVVTSKLDMREVAVRLPVGEEDEPVEIEDEREEDENTEAFDDVCLAQA